MKRRTTLVSIVILLIGMIVVHTVWAEQSSIDRAEQEFIRNALTAGMLEIQMGQMAIPRTADAHIRQFAKQMLTDHAALNTELRHLAEQKGIKYPNKLDKAFEVELKRLSKLNDESFDREYVKASLKNHREEMSYYSSAANNANDPDVKQFASKTMAGLQQHLSLITKIEEQLTETK